MREHDEWIIGESANHQRWYIMHMRPPRFLCEVFEADDDAATLAPFVFARGPYQLAGFMWFDDPPPKKGLRRLLSDACAVLESYDEPPEALAAAETLGQRLRALRDNYRPRTIRDRLAEGGQRGLTCAAMARKLAQECGLHVDPHTIYRWEHCKTTPDEEKIVVLADFFGVSPAFLRYGTS